MTESIFMFVLGLGFLIVGAEFLVRGASRFAARLGVPSIIIGLTIVAYGTSAPELIVSTKSAYMGQPDIALGNVLGSNIFNVLFILGASALIAPLVVSRQLVWQEVPIMIAVSLIAMILALDGIFSRFDGFIFLSLLIGYTVFQVRLGLNQNNIKSDDNEVSKSTHSIPKSMLFMVVGLVVLVFGARWLLESSVFIARSYGVSELVIGLTIVAAGTSLPEVATSLLATWRGERDIAVGNVVGSNLFNLMGVLGLSSVVAPSGIPVSAAALGFDMPIMLMTAVACLPIFFTGHKIERWEGFVFLGYYVVYTAFLILQAQKHDALPVFGQIMISFVLPMTVLTLMIGFYRHVKNHQYLVDDEKKG